MEISSFLIGLYIGAVMFKTLLHPAKRFNQGEGSNEYRTEL
jgi:hypothetical protein